MACIVVTQAVISMFIKLCYQVGIGEGCALSMAAIAPSAIFLPGFLLLAGILPFWSFIYRFPKAHAVVGGLNAAVVGLLAAALY